MKLIKICLSIFLVGLTSLAMATPATKVGGAENLAASGCPVLPPPTCPPGNSCNPCSVCVAPSPCQICEPPPPCQNYSVDFLSNLAGDLSTKVVIDQSKAKDLGCFETIVNKSLDALRDDMQWYDADWGTYSKDSKFDKSAPYYGHEYGGLLTSMIWEQLKKENGLKSSVNYYSTDGPGLLADNTKAQGAISCTGEYNALIPDRGMWQFGGAFTGDKKSLVDGCTSGSLYLDKDCKFVDVNSVNNNNLCGSIDFYAEISTPISLVWNKDQADVASTMVSFKLNPHSSEKTWLWRGSDALPLLVYDPEHKGVITSATQLFGSWTFGGNGLASLFEGTTKGTPWKDGYEALSKMDKDLDGKVSGAELKDLALWFDKNRDGISQKGEVKTLSDVSVTSLFYKADTIEAGALVASKGYEREIDGKNEILASMDWSEKSVNDGFDVMMDGLKAALKTSTTNIGQSTDHAKDNAKPAIYGAWGWKLEAPAKGSGIFSFDPSKDGILGATISQVAVVGNPKAVSQILFSHFKVDETKNAEGASGIKFVVDKGNGMILTNTASLSEDGKRLVGKTVVSGSKLSASGSYEYAWKAERLR